MSNTQGKAAPNPAQPCVLRQAPSGTRRGETPTRAGFVYLGWSLGLAANVYLFGRCIAALLGID